MTKHQIKKLTMFLAVQNLIANTEPTILALMPSFNIFYSKLKDYITTLLEQSIIQNQPIKGYKELKTSIQNLMIEQAIAIEINIMAYAEVNDKIKLKSEVKYNKSMLSKTNEINCIDACRNIYKVAKENLAELADFNVTAEIINEFKTTIDDFSNIFPLPKDYINIKKMATADIKNTFTLGTVQILKMDSLVKMLLVSQKEFANRYFSLRVIHRPPHRTIAIKVNISDQDKNPLGKVRITSDKIKFKKPKFTTKLGNFQIQDLESDVYTITLYKPGFKTLTIEVPITAGERTQLKLTLIPNL